MSLLLNVLLMAGLVWFLVRNRQQRIAVHTAEPVAETDSSCNKNIMPSPCECDLEFLQRLDEVIKGQLSNSDLQIIDICKEMDISRTAIYTKVKAITQHSPNDYLRIYRLNEAKRLLETKKWTIAEVAVKVGYSDPKYFSTSFKKQFGISPSKIIKI